MMEEQDQSQSIARISLGVVAYNEAEMLPGLFDDILAQDYPHELIELILVDSCSVDGTRFLMQDFARRTRGFLRIEVLQNPGRYLPQGINVLLDNYRTDALIRVDAHARIPTDFLRCNVECLNRGEDVCGGLRPVIIKEPSAWGSTLLLAEESLFGSSPARYRRQRPRDPSGASSAPPQPAHVSSVFHAAYRRAVLARVGRFDERLRRTEDNDYSSRVRRAGYSICLDPAIRSWQYLRSDLGALLCQKAANGYWIGVTQWLSPAAVRPFHLVPAAFVLASVLTLVIGLAATWIFFLLLAALYLLAASVMSIQALRTPRRTPGAPERRVESGEWGVERGREKGRRMGERRRRRGCNPTVVALPFVFFLMHVCYGGATLAGLVNGAWMFFQQLLGGNRG